MSHLFLTGGGRDPDGRHQTNVPFAQAVLATGCSHVSLIVLDEGEDTDVDAPAAALALVGLEPEVFLVGPGRPPMEARDSSAVYVTGGPTPGFQAALCPDASWLPADAIYGGFSAGAAIAPALALVGGWRMDGASVCAEDSGEGLEHVEVRSGLGLLEPVIDVHCAQWGNLGRLVEVVRSGDGRPGWGLDEHTTLEFRHRVPVAVHGEGAAWLVERLDEERVTVRPQRSGPLQP